MWFGGSTDEPVQPAGIRSAPRADPQQGLLLAVAGSVSAASLAPETLRATRVRATAVEIDRWKRQAGTSRSPLRCRAGH